MKKLMFSLLFIAGSTAFACKSNEAQVFGKVLNVASDSNKCSYLIRLDEVMQHRVCSLDAAMEGRVVIVHQLDNRNGCRFKVGESMSGILVQEQNKDFIQLD